MGAVIGPRFVAPGWSRSHRAVIDKSSTLIVSVFVPLFGSTIIAMVKEKWALAKSGANRRRKPIIPKRIVYVCIRFLTTTI
jgi:hypothetical protein